MGVFSESAEEWADAAYEQGVRDGGGNPKLLRELRNEIEHWKAVAMNNRKEVDDECVRLKSELDSKKQSYVWQINEKDEEIRRLRQTIGMLRNGKGAAEELLPVKFEKGAFVIGSNDLHKIVCGFGEVCQFWRIDADTSTVKCTADTYMGGNEMEFVYILPIDKFAPNNIEEMKKHVLKVNCGELVRAEVFKD